MLVHDYLNIDRKIVYEALQHRLKDLERLRSVGGTSGKTSVAMEQGIRFSTGVLAKRISQAVLKMIYLRGRLYLVHFIIFHYT